MIYETRSRYSLHQQKFWLHIFHVFRKAWKFSIKFWNSDERLKRNIFTFLFLKFKAFVHSQITISHYCILITNFLTWQPYSQPCQISKTELFLKIVNVWRLLVIFARSSILDVWHCSEYTSAWYEVEGYIGFTLVTFSKLPIVL